jgi:hypothetical protein
MNDAFAVSVLERARDFDADTDGFENRKSSALETPGQRFALQVFHYKKREPLVIAHVVDRANVRLREPRRSLRFAHESSASCRVVGNVSGKDLDRDAAAEPRIRGSVDFTHRAGIERGIDRVRAEASARLEGHADYGL